jgi:DMSO/TMAO reductase YedYZ molybdopterin-dependent catalytic subunit
MPVNDERAPISFVADGSPQRPKLMVDVDRRKFLRNGMSLGALTLLTGCDISDNDVVQQMFGQVSRWNNFVQEALFRGTKLAPEYPEQMAVKDFRYNAWYQAPLAPVISAAEYKFELAGLIADKRPWSVQQLYALPQKSQVTRHVCVEGWSMIGKWSGTPLKTFLNRVGADITAKYVGFVCADGYYESIDMPTALHPQTIMAFKLSDNILPVKYGFPFKIRIPTKLGFKQPKFVTAIYVTNRNPGGFWVDRGYNWFSGI